VVYSYTQISQYLRCPRSYRYRYLDGWREKDTRAAMVFGRCFEQALSAYFHRQDPAAVLFREWGAYRDAALDYPKGHSWDKMLHQGVHLLHKFAQEDRIHIRQPKKNLQLKMTRSLGNGAEFVAYIDAIGELDGERYLIDWKTTTSRYSQEPDGLLALDPQLVCYSWISGISEVALGCIRPQELARDPVPQGIDHGGAAEGIRRAGSFSGRADRERAVPAAQRHPVSPERLHKLLSSGSLPQQPAVDRYESHPPARSERP